MEEDDCESARGRILRLPPLVVQRVSILGREAARFTSHSNLGIIQPEWYLRAADTTNHPH